ncbi:hypothetical protein EDC96DRAFT_513295 [Choanephora cucurbitarum]|nr:hypothetical protein EDC96DRAFT_513295 [Choanephora cucurbitarum]
MRKKLWFIRILWFIPTEIVLAAKLLLNESGEMLKTNAPLLHIKSRQEQTHATTRSNHLNLFIYQIALLVGNCSNFEILQKALQS